MSTENIIKVYDRVDAIDREEGLLALWFTWKRINNVVYNPQLDFFRENNQWGTLSDPALIRPFPIKTPGENRGLMDSFIEP